MERNPVVRPWPLSEAIGSLVARVRIAGTVRSQHNTLTHSSHRSGPSSYVPSIGPGNLLVATHLE